MCQPMEYVTVGITVYQSAPPPPPPPPPPPSIPAKWLQIMKKYAKCSGRLKLLAIPKLLTPKFIYKIEKPLRYGPRQILKLTDETTYYSDQQSRPLVRTLVINKRMFGKLKGRKFVRKINKRLTKAWDSIYNYYKKKEREKKLRLMRREALQTKSRKSKTFLRTPNLAKPKRIFKPTPPKRKKPKKIFSDFTHLVDLAAPRFHYEEPPKRYGVSPFAMQYIPTEIISKLAALPERWLHLPKPLVPGQVQRGALKYKLTPKTEALAVPRKRSEKAKEDEGYDPFTISKFALKYKPTPRILELAKPIERS